MPPSMHLAMHLVVPMSGQGTRFLQAGYTGPKPLIDINGTPMVQRLLTCFPAHWPSTFVLAENHRTSALPQCLRGLRPDGVQVFIPEHKRGPSYALLAALENIPEEAPVFVSYCDYGMVWDAAAFERFVTDTACDVALVSYRGFHAHYLSPQMYAYSRLHNDRVVEVREKGCFTDQREQEFASTGGYYFRTARLLRTAIDAQQSQDLQLNGEYYTSLTIEALLRQRPSTDVRVFEIPAFFQWGTPQDVQRFVFWERTFQAQLARPRDHGEVAQVLMPMAGVGSRFGHLSALPKPLIPVGDTPMYRAALHTLPRAKNVVLVARDTLAPALQACSEGLEVAPRVIALEATPPGQALSCEAGVAALNPDGDLLVTACDHGIVTPAATWETLRQDAACDAAIFTMTGFTGADASPRSYSYVEASQAGPTFATVKRVGVKEPLSRTPSRDPVLVGTFWFRNAAVMTHGIDALKAADVRVNGELYLDSIFNLLIAAGYCIRMVPLQGFICWGEPDALAEALYWQEVFSGHGANPRPRYGKGLSHASV